MKIYIVGAHSRGTTMGYYLQYLNPDLEIEAYLYDNEEINPSDVNGVPVIKIDKTSKLNVDLPVYIGTRGINHQNIQETLEACGMKKIIPVDVKLDLDIRNEYLKKYYASIGREYVKIDDLKVPDGWISEIEKCAKVYVASSAFDKPLQNPYTLLEYEKKIQVGAALTDIRLDDASYDNEGENISKKNAQFCELTGLYWIWKHAVEDVIGLVHYRRHFVIPEDWEKRMEANGVDVVLPLPLYVSPNIEGNYRGRHVEGNWDSMLNYLKKNLPDDYDKANEFFKNTALYSPCNMFIMRKSALDDLGSWLFPILFAVAEQGGMLEDSYQNRYPGFISERLITYFFEKNKDKYRVVYADKNFLL